MDACLSLVFNLKSPGHKSDMPIKELPSQALASILAQDAECSVLGGSVLGQDTLEPWLGIGKYP